MSVQAQSGDDDSVSRMSMHHNTMQGIMNNKCIGGHITPRRSTTHARTHTMFPMRKGQSWANSKRSGAQRADSIDFDQKGGPDKRKIPHRGGHNRINDLDQRQKLQETRRKARASETEICSQQHCGGVIKDPPARPGRHRHQPVKRLQGTMLNRVSHQVGSRTRSWQGHKTRRWQSHNPPPPQARARDRT